MGWTQHVKMSSNISRSQWISVNQKQVHLLLTDFHSSKSHFKNATMAFAALQLFRVVPIIIGGMDTTCSFIALMLFTVPCSNSNWLSTNFNFKLGNEQKKRNRNLIKPQCPGKVKKRPSSSAKKRPSSTGPRGAQRKSQPHPKPVDLDMKKMDVFKWAHRICTALVNSGYDKCGFKVLNVYTEFSGSTCAESSVQSIVNNIMGQSFELHFKSTADIKSTCRTVCMSTRGSLRVKR